VVAHFSRLEISFEQIYAGLREVMGCGAVRVHHSFLMSIDHPSSTRWGGKGVEFLGRFAQGPSGEQQLHRLLAEGLGMMFSTL